MFLSIGTARNLIIFSCPNTYLYYGSQKIFSTGDKREGQGRKRNESEVTEEIETFPLYSYQLQGKQALPNGKPVSDGRPGDVRYTIPSPYPTTPFFPEKIILDISCE